MTELVAIKPKNTPYVSITWQVSDFCNFQCSYCNPGNWQGNHRNDRGLETVKYNFDKIFAYFENQGYCAFKFYFSGGEPTFWKNLIPLIEWLNERLDEPQIGINTNLSRPLKYWEQYYHLFHDIVASFHVEFVKKDRYLENVKYLQDKVNYLCCRMMMHEGRFEEVRDYGYMLRNELNNYNIEWVPLFDDISIVAGPWEYKEQWKKDFFVDHNFDSQTTIPKPPGSRWEMASKEVYDNGSEKDFNGNRLTAERKNFFQGWKCWVSEGLFIDNRGNVSAASCGQGPRLGNVFSEINLKLDPIICNKYQCTCGTDLLLTKEKAY